MKTFLSLLFLFIGLSVIGQTKNFTLSGKITGLEGEPFSIAIKDDSAPRGYFRDSIVVAEDGTFSYSMYVKDVTYMSLWPGTDKVMKKVKSGGYYPIKSSQLQFIASPGARIYFSGKATDFIDAYPTGDAANDDLASLNKRINPLTNRVGNLMVKLADKEITDSAEVKQANKEVEELDDQVNNIKKEFLQSHPSSVVAAWLLSDMMIRSQVTDEEAVNYFKNLNKEKLVSTPYYVEVAKRVDGINATALGKDVPDFSSLNTYDKKKFELKSLRGKYVVLDFWGTWCGPCISGMPKMKEYLDKYKDKMDIVGIAQESDDGTSWRNFLAKNKDYNWHQVLSRPDEDYILKFNVAGFPTKIIVDPQGKIVERFVGEDDAIYNKLDELLN